MDTISLILIGLGIFLVFVLIVVLIGMMTNKGDIERFSFITNRPTLVPENLETVENIVLTAVVIFVILLSLVLTFTTGKENQEQFTSKGVNYEWGAHNNCILKGNT